MTMGRVFSSRSAGLALFGLLASGCDDAFAPPRRAKPIPTVVGPVESKPTFLVFVTPPAPGYDVLTWGLRAQHEANDKRAIFRSMVSTPNEAADGQPEIIRKAITEGASALIVYPGTSPELPRALAEAETKAIPVVLLEKPLAAPEGAKPFTVVEYGPFDETAKQIVGGAIEDLKKNNRPIDGTAVILVDKVVDATSARRVAALKAAAGATKFARVITVEFDGSRADQAKAAALGAVKANPDLSVMLTEDGEGLVAAADSRSDSRGKPVFFVGGYFNTRPSQVIMPPERESGYVDGRYVELAGQAVLTALAKLRGDPIGEHVYLPIRYVKTEGAVSTESDPASSRPEVKLESRAVPPPGTTIDGPKPPTPKPQ